MNSVEKVTDLRNNGDDCDERSSACQNTPVFNYGRLTKDYIPPQENLKNPVI